MSTRKGDTEYHFKAQLQSGVTIKYGRLLQNCDPLEAFELIKGGLPDKAVITNVEQFVRNTTLDDGTVIGKEWTRIRDIDNPTAESVANFPITVHYPKKREPKAAAAPEVQASPASPEAVEAA